MVPCAVEGCGVGVVWQCRCLQSDQACAVGHYTHVCPKCRKRVQHAAEDKTHMPGYDARCDKCKAIPHPKDFNDAWHPAGGIQRTGGTQFVNSLRARGLSERDIQQVLEELGDTCLACFDSPSGCYCMRDD